MNMAKTQDLPLNPGKVSGVCGRLLCCLSYENEQYRQMKAVMPRLGQAIDSPAGPGMVVSMQILKEVVTVRLDSDHTDHVFSSVDLGFKKPEPVAAPIHSRQPRRRSVQAASEPRPLKTPVESARTSAETDRRRGSASPPSARPGQSTHGQLSRRHSARRGETAPCRDISSSTRRPLNSNRRPSHRLARSRGADIERRPRRPMAEDLVAGFA